MKNKHSVRKMNGTIIKDSIIREITENIRFAPSAFNLQPYHIIVIKNRQTIRDLQETIYGKKIDLTTASHLIIFCSNCELSDDFIEQRCLEYKDYHEKEIEEITEYQLKLIRMFGRMSSDERQTFILNQLYLGVGVAEKTIAEKNLDSCIIGGFDKTKTSEILQNAVRDDSYPEVILMIGQSDKKDTDIMREPLREKEEKFVTVI